MEKTIITSFKNRQQFFELQKINPGLIIVKVGATWCKPCHAIKDIVHGFFATSPDYVVCADIDVDESFDYYAFLKARKIVNGIPALLCYTKENQSFMPNLIHTGADLNSLDKFLKDCGKLGSVYNN